MREIAQWLACSRRSFFAFRSIFRVAACFVPLATITVTANSSTLKPVCRVNEDFRTVLIFNLPSAD